MHPDQLTHDQLNLLVVALNSHVTALVKVREGAEGAAQKADLDNQLAKASALAYQLATTKPNPPATGREYSVTLLRADRSEVTTSYPSHLQAAVFAHMASYAADGYNFRVTFK